MKSEKEKEIYLKGAPVSEGIAIGIPIFLSYGEEDVPDFPISSGEVEGEITRYRQALASSREDLKKLQADLTSEGSKEVASIIGTHIEMLDDPIMTTHVESKIREMLKNTEAVFHAVINDYETRFNKTSDSFFKERLSDFKDLSQRVLRNLGDGNVKISLENIPPNSIVFIKELIPSDTASIQASRISAFVTQHGGGTSHAALIARAKGIPYVASIDMEIFQNAKGKCVIVDGLTGDIIVNPSRDTLEKYERLKNRLTTHYHQLEKDKHLLSETSDGYPIYLYANVTSMSDIDFVHHQRAHGIGLFRSEYLFMQDGSLFYDEDRQYLIYQQILKKAGPIPFTFRVLDVGGDKCSNFFEELSKEPNPVLGCRGIRFLLRRTDIFKIQLRALFRAASKRELRILFPLISDIAEFREVKRIVWEVQEELRAENIPFNPHHQLGCMLEVPSAILICDVLAQEADFLALGTNDLIQYTLGIDRNNPGMSDFYYPTHPSVIRMIKMTILEAKRFQKSITICGEIASNPLFTALLIGLGVQNISCAPRFIPVIKRTLRHLSLLDCCEMAEHILTMRSSAEISKYLSDSFHLFNGGFP